MNNINFQNNIDLSKSWKTSNTEKKTLYVSQQ